MKGVGESELKEVKISHRCKALVVLNLQSYGGGRDVFGLKSNPESLAKEGFQVPIFNDGLLEVRSILCWMHGVDSLTLSLTLLLGPSPSPDFYRFPDPNLHPRCWI